MTDKSRSPRTLPWQLLFASYFGKHGAVRPVKHLCARESMCACVHLTLQDVSMHSAKEVGGLKISEVS